MANDRPVVFDDDNPEWTIEDFARGRPASKVLSAEALEAFRRFRGSQKAPTKQQVTLRLDRDLLDRFRAGGPGWQSRINETLRKAIG